MESDTLFFVAWWAVNSTEWPMGPWRRGLFSGVLISCLFPIRLDYLQALLTFLFHLSWAAIVSHHFRFLNIGSFPLLHIHNHCDYIRKQSLYHSVCFFDLLNDFDLNPTLLDYGTCSLSICISPVVALRVFLLVVHECLCSREEQAAQSWISLRDPVCQSFCFNRRQTHAQFWTRDVGAETHHISLCHSFSFTSFKDPWHCLIALSLYMLILIIWKVIFCAMR